MFPSRYFADRYFPGSYWTHAGAEGITSSPLLLLALTQPTPWTRRAEISESVWTKRSPV